MNSSPNASRAGGQNESPLIPAISEHDVRVYQGDVREILAGCPEGGTVLDPFTGSGTTAMVARRLLRKFVGAELNPAYLPLIRDRIGQTPFDFGEAVS